METPSPPLPSMLLAEEIQRIRDTEHLRLLSIGYYLVGGFTAVFSSFGLIHLCLGLLMLAGVFPPGPPPRPRPMRQVAQAPAVPSVAEPLPAARPFSPEPDALPQKVPFAPGEDMPRRPPNAEFPRAIGFLFVLIGGAVVFLGWSVGGLTIFAGRCLHRRSRRTFTLVMAGVNCLHVPFGTAMGVCTFLVLQRPSVDLLYRLPPEAAGNRA